MRRPFGAPKSFGTLVWCLTFFALARCTTGGWSLKSKYNALSCAESIQNRSFRILTTGMQRSGSTWQFNAARLILQEALNRTIPTFHGGPGEVSQMLVFQRDHPTAYVIKIHQYEPVLIDNTDFVLTCHRDLRDVAISYYKMQSSIPVGHPWDFPQFTRFFNHYLNWVPLALYDMEYEMMKADPGAAVLDIATRLGVQHCINPDRLAEQVEEARRTTKKDWDPLTAFHRTDHVHADSTDPQAYLRLFSSLEPGAKQLVEAVMQNATYRLWLKAHQYEVAPEEEARSVQDQAQEIAGAMAGADAAVMVNAGVEALEAGNQAKAEALFSLATRQQGTVEALGVAWSNLAEVQRMKGEYEAAVGSLEEAVRVHPGGHSGRATRAHVHHLRTLAASQVFQTALDRLKPTAAQQPHALHSEEVAEMVRAGRLFLELEHEGEAGEETTLLNAAIAFGTAGAHLAAAGHHRQAIEQFANAASAAPYNVHPDALHSLGLAAEALEEDLEAAGSALVTAARQATALAFREVPEVRVLVGSDARPPAWLASKPPEAARFWNNNFLPRLKIWEYWAAAALAAARWQARPEGLQEVLGEWRGWRAEWARLQAEGADDHVGAAVRALRALPHNQPPPATPPGGELERGVVVYLCCSGPRGLLDLALNLHLLWLHFRRRWPYPVVVFHEGLAPEQQAWMTWIARGHDFLAFEAFQAHRPAAPEDLQPGDDIRFVQVEIAGPSSIERSEGEADKLMRGPSYRRMIRFFAHDMWQMPLLDHVDWVWRLDTDGFLYEPVAYDLFREMAAGGFEYGAAALQVDSLEVVKGLWEVTKKFAKRGGYSLKGPLVNLFRSGKGAWNRLCFYNNFELSSVRLWRSAEYKEYYKAIEEAGGIDAHRWGDSPIHTLAVLMFLDPQKLRWLDDMPYWHQYWLGGVY